MATPGEPGKATTIGSWTNLAGNPIGLEQPGFPGRMASSASTPMKNPLGLPKRCGCHDGSFRCRLPLSLSWQQELTKSWPERRVTPEHIVVTAGSVGAADQRVIYSWQGEERS